MLRIRLTRTGKKHQPTYRIVVAEHSAPIQGKFIEIVGYYIPTTKPKTLEVKKERVEYWISNGAVPTDTIHNLLVDAKILTEKRNIRYAKEKQVEKEETKTDKKAVVESEQSVEATETPAADESNAEDVKVEVTEPTQSDEPAEDTEEPSEPSEDPENPTETPAE